jgi:dephospho-CoA kinase
MLVLGIVGGIASGKSLVSTTLARWGAEVVDADRLGHEVLRESATMSAARNRWGDEVFAPSGDLDRQQIAQRVFGDTAEARRERQFLEQLTHPQIATRAREAISHFATRGDVDVVVLDAALLLEAGWNEYCDHILFIDAPRDVRLSRSMARGWSEAEFDKREASQMSLSLKRKQADIVIDNGGSAEETTKQLAAVWHSLMAEATRDT